MKKKLTIEEKQNILILEIKAGLQKHPEGYAIFEIEKDVVQPLIERGIIHRDTYRFTGGATLTKKYRD